MFELFQTFRFLKQSFNSFKGGVTVTISRKSRDLLMELTMKERKSNRLLVKYCW